MSALSSRPPAASTSSRTRAAVKAIHTWPQHRAEHVALDLLGGSWASDSNRWMGAHKRRRPVPRAVEGLNHNADAQCANQHQQAGIYITPRQYSADWAADINH